jgi:hypothetical protein
MKTVHFKAAAPEPQGSISCRGVAAVAVFRKLGVVLLAGAMISADCGRVGALTIELYDVGATPMTAEQLAAFTEAATLWENILLDPITVKINAQFVSMQSSTILGSTFSVPTTHSFTTVRSALLSASNSVFETGVLTLLPASKVPLNDIDGFREDSKLTINAANAKVLGLGTTMDPTYGCPPEDPCPLENSADAFMSFNTKFNFDYDRSDGVSATKHDFITVACHEIGHVLGFTSTTDVQDAYPAYNLHPTTMDLWRFADTGGAHDLTAEARLACLGPTSGCRAIEVDIGGNRRQWRRHDRWARTLQRASKGYSARFWKWRNRKQSEPMPPSSHDMLGKC